MHGLTQVWELVAEEVGGRCMCVRRRVPAGQADTATAWPDLAGHHTPLWVCVGECVGIHVYRMSGPGRWWCCCWWEPRMGWARGGLAHLPPRGTGPD